MSNDVFPTLPGLKWGTVKSPIFSTKKLSAASGRGTRGSFWSYPLWKFTLSYEFLRGGNGYDELQELVGFFCQRLGQWDSFLFRDPADYTVASQALGVGDGTTKEFRFVRAFGGYVEPVLAPDDMWLYLDRGAALGKWRVSHQSRTNGFARTDDLSNVYWTKDGATVTINATAAPDGTTTADRFTEDSGTTTHRFYKSLTPPGGADVKHAISWYVKANGRTNLMIDPNWDGVTGTCEFDLSGSGSVVTATLTGGILAAGIRALSNGWFRIWVVVRPTGTGTGSQVLYLKATEGGSTTYAGNGTSGIYATWMQVEEIPEDAPEEPTEYIPSVGSAPTTAVAAFTLSELGYFTFATAPPSGVLLSWSGTFYFRVYFTHDSTETAQFLQDLYELRKVEFITDK